MKLKLFFFLIGATFFSCSDDDRSAEVKNEILFNGKVFSVTNGYQRNTSNDISNSFQLVIAFENIVPTSGPSIGEGILLSVTLKTPTSTDIENGTYMLATNNSSPFQFNIAEFFISEGYEGSDGILALLGGTIEVSGSNEQKTIVLDLNHLDEDELTGSFKGVLENY